MEPNHGHNQFLLSPTKINGHVQGPSNLVSQTEPPVEFERRLEFNSYEPSSNDNQPNPTTEDSDSVQGGPDYETTPTEPPEGHNVMPSPYVNDPGGPEGFYLHDKNQSHYSSDSNISYNNNYIQALDSSCGSSGKGKQIDGVALTMDYKLQVLRWAYTKTIPSAGHHFNLERCVVRNWMMNEEKIYNSATEKGKRKWRNFDSRVMRHYNCRRPVPGKEDESYLIDRIEDLSV